ncbi:MAG TPA: pyridoxal phosphate-dependent aminotransferase [Oligoflexia bacterium]|nr:pyridoxal phosphate-dependent aminotransferase [Oligoflexia bacterium]HMP48871.1 pyridoxal phosphate-dependent aminotransferase [Oligoflexia bacterium]
MKVENQLSNLRRISERVSLMKPSGVRRFFALASTLDRCLDLSIGQPDFKVPDDLKETAQQSIQNNFNGYTQSKGIEPALSVLREKYQLKDDSCDVVLASGVMGALFLSFSCLLDPGDEILVPDPYFVGYKELAHLLGAVPVFFDTYPDFSPDIDRIESLIGKKTKAIVLASPANPTGYVMSKAEVEEVQTLCDKHGIYLIYDEIYENFYYDQVHSRPVMKDNVIILGGLSKGFAATGWRMAWCVVPKNLVSEFEKVQQFSFVCPPAPFQHCIAPALKLDLSRTCELYRRRRDYVYSRLKNSFNLKMPGGAFYFFPGLKNGMSSEAFVEKCLERKLLVIPSTVFSRKDTHFRLSYAVQDSVLEEAIDILISIGHRN